MITLYDRVLAVNTTNNWLLYHTKVYVELGVYMQYYLRS